MRFFFSPASARRICHFDLGIVGEVFVRTHTRAIVGRNMYGFSLFNTHNVQLVRITLASARNRFFPILDLRHTHTHTQKRTHTAKLATQTRTSQSTARVNFSNSRARGCRVKWKKVSSAYRFRPSQMPRIMKSNING